MQINNFKKITIKLKAKNALENKQLKAKNSVKQISS